MYPKNYIVANKHTRSSVLFVHESNLDHLISCRQTLYMSLARVNKCDHELSLFLSQKREEEKYKV